MTKIESSTYFAILSIMVVLSLSIFVKCLENMWDNGVL